MTADRFISIGLACALSFLPVPRAQASDLGAGLLGGIIGGVIVNESIKSRQNQRQTVYRNSVNSTARAQNREVQTSLNYFSFPAGNPDGVMGRNSRNAISQYQAHLGYPATGQLTPYERDFLVTSYHRAIAGGAATNQLIAADPRGSRGLLISYRDQLAGAPTTTVSPGTTVVVTPQVSVQPPVVAAAGNGLPTFMGQSGSISLASHCNKVSLLTNSNGGFVTEASMGDPNQALNEQFCLARTYAIAQGEELASQVQGFSAGQIAQQCAAFGPAMKEHVAGLSLKSEQDVLQGVGGFVLQSGMSPAQLAGTAKICLSVGYRTDDMDVAIGSALLLVVLGNPVYAELMGHHLAQGIGAGQRADLAQIWYQTGLEAISNGAAPVFAPGQPERNDLIRKAAFQVNGGAGEATTKPQNAGLPVFKILK